MPDLSQVDLMNFRVEYVRPLSSRCLGREAAERQDEELFRKSRQMHANISIKSSIHIPYRVE